MLRLTMPKFLHEVFGEQQSVIEIALTVIFSLVGTGVIFYNYSQTHTTELTWQLIASFIIIADILAGCLANFSRGTNDFYASKPKNRLTFIAIHFHIILVAWLLNADMQASVQIWLYTIISALGINYLITHRLQLFIAATLLAFGLLLLLQMSLPSWFIAVSLFFMVKVIFSFAVNHYSVKELEV